MLLVLRCGDLGLRIVWAGFRVVALGGSFRIESWKSSISRFNVGLFGAEMGCRWGEGRVSVRDRISAVGIWR